MLKKPPVALDMPGTWPAKAAGLKLTPHPDFGCAPSVSVFGGSISFDKEGRPRPKPVVESPREVARVAAPAQVASRA